jgi:hypothetical protein
MNLIFDFGIVSTVWNFCLSFYWYMVVANKEAIKTNVISVYVEVIASNVLRSPPWLKWRQKCLVHRNHNSIISSNMLYQWFVTRLTRRVPKVKWELFPLLEHLRSPPVFCFVRVAKPFVFCILLCISWFAVLFLFICPLHCLSFFDLGLMITDSVSSTSFS